VIGSLQRFGRVVAPVTHCRDRCGQKKSPRMGSWSWKSDWIAATIGSNRCTRHSLQGSDRIVASVVREIMLIHCGDHIKSFDLGRAIASLQRLDRIVAPVTRCSDRTGSLHLLLPAVIGSLE
jgi:hypothetical protein